MKSCSGLFIGLLLSVSVGAESLLEGRVRLESGYPVADAQIAVFDMTDLRQGAIARALTDGTGYFALPLAALAGRALPARFALGANYPNPFNPSTIIPYQLPTAMHVRLEVFNILGQRIATLVEGERAGGFHTARWDATDAAGQAMAAGVYFYRLSGDGVHVTRRMVLIDGQAGVPSAGGGGLGAVVEVKAEMAPVYGLVVSGRGFVPYVDPAFRVEASRGLVDLVVETLDSVARAKALAAGILGDVNNDGRVDFFDALLVALYSGDASMVMPNNGDPSLGDVNADGRVDLTDAWLIAAYLNDPSDPTLPSGIGEPVGAVGFALIDEQTFNSQMVSKSFHAETWFLDFVSAGRFRENGRLPGSYSYSNTGSNTGLLKLTYDGGQYGGGCTVQLTFASATTGTLSYTCDSGLEGQEIWRISEIGTPLAPRVVPRSGTDTELEVLFIAFFEAGETRAYDFQWRTKTPQGSWLGGCDDFTNTAGRAINGPVSVGIGNLESGTVYEVRYRYRNSSRCGEGTPGPWSEIGEGATTGGGTSLLRFPYGESTTRSIRENIPAGINVGAPVFAVGGDTLTTATYTIGGPDAYSFDIVPETGQIRTREGVTYDYESKNRYSVTVGVEDGAGNSNTIDVTIHILNLVPSCGLPSNLNLRTNHSDERLTIRWDPLPDMQGYARVLGYQTEIRQSSSRPWTDRRTFLGRNIAAMIYANLINGLEYQVRIRPINAEGDCGWATPVWGTPTADFAPKNPLEHFDRFGPQPVGSPDRNFRFLTPERCRHTSNGRTLDADCRYENTGPHTGRIFLEFDDSSQGSCEVTLAYSSLTAGSFIDECFDAGVNTNVPFDRSFRMPRAAPPRSKVGLDPPPPETATQRAPRSQEEFDALVYGRDDFIPGLCFGNCNSSAPAEKGVARRFAVNSDGVVSEHHGDYTYESTGPSQGELTFAEQNGNTWVFDLDFEPSGNIRAMVTDPDGDVTTWPGLLHLESTLGAEPILLPIPTSMLYFEADINRATAPQTLSALAALASEASADLVSDRKVVELLMGHTFSSFLGDRGGRWLAEKLSDKLNPSLDVTYERLGNQRVRISIRVDEYHSQPLWEAALLSAYGIGFTELTELLKTELTELLKNLTGLSWIGHAITVLEWALSYLGVDTDTPDNSPNLVQWIEGYVLGLWQGSSMTYDCQTTTGSQAFGCQQTISKDSEEPITFDGLIDFSGDIPNLDEFPEELLLPDDPPQASAEDVSGVEVAAAVSNHNIGSDDLQTFLVSSAGAGFQPGDWLEPKDGSNQRMMVVGTGAAKPVASSDPASSRLHQRILKMQSAISPHSSPAISSALVPRAKRVSQSAYWTSSSTFTQLSVVCMQGDRDIPTRGARYFSQPKTAQGAVQLCQQDCVLNETDNIQGCVWECEANAP